MKTPMISAHSDTQTMPLTPLHLAIGLPIRKFASIKAFILINILIDLEVAAVMFFNMERQGYNLHMSAHTFEGASVLTIFTVLVGIPYRKGFLAWCGGAFLGAYSHLLLDGLVHWDVQPFYPFIKGNPIYLDAHLSVSILCALVLCYYLAQWVVSLRIGEVGPSLIRKLRGRFFPGTPGE